LKQNKTQFQAKNKTRKQIKTQQNSNKAQNPK